MAGSIDGGGGHNVNIVTRGGGLDEPGSVQNNPQHRFKQAVAKKYGLDISFHDGNAIRFNGPRNDNRIQLAGRMHKGAVDAGKLLGKNRNRRDQFARHLLSLTAKANDGELMAAGNRLASLTANAGTPNEHPHLKPLKQALRVSAGKPDRIHGSWIKGNSDKAQMLRAAIRKTVLTTYLKTGSIQDAQKVRQQMIAELHKKNADNPRISNMQAYFNSKPGQPKGMDTFSRMMVGSEDLPARDLHDAINGNWPAKRAAGGVRVARDDSNVNRSNRNVEPGQQRVVNIDSRSRASSATTVNSDAPPPPQPGAPDENKPLGRARGQSDAASYVSDDKVDHPGRRVDDERARKEQIEGDREIAKYMEIKDKRTLGGDRNDLAVPEHGPQTTKGGEADDVSDNDSVVSVNTPGHDDDGEEGVETIRPAPVPPMPNAVDPNDAEDPKVVVETIE